MGEARKKIETRGNDDKNHNTSQISHEWSSRMSRYTKVMLEAVEKQKEPWNEGWVNWIFQRPRSAAATHDGLRA